MTSGGMVQEVGRLFFIVVIAVLYEEGAATVGAFECVLISRKNVLRFVEPDDLDILADEAECFGVVADVLVLWMERSLRADAGADDDFGLVTAGGHIRQFVEMADDLVDGEEKEVPARTDGHWHKPCECKPC